MASDNETLAIIRQLSSHRSLPANMLLFQQGDPLQYIYLLEKGLVKTTRADPDGRELILDLRLAGSLIGIVSVLANEPAQMNAQTVTPCEVYRLSVNEFLQLEKKRAAFWSEMLELVSRQRNEQLNLRAQQNMMEARDRLMILLARLAKEFSVERNGQIHLALPLAKQDLAGMLGITPQRLSVILKQLKVEGLIAEENGWIILMYLQALR